MWRILRYIILLSVAGWCAVLPAQDEAEPAAEAEEQEPEKMPLYQGVLVEADAFSAVMSAVWSDRYSFEAGVRVDLRDKFFPAFEMGVAGADRTSVNGYGFKTDGVFFRIGGDYNLLKPTPPEARIQRYFLIGVRYAFSPFAYDVTDIRVDNGYWSDDVMRDYLGVRTVQHWMEVVGGLHVEVARNLYLGWGVRRKIRFGSDDTGEVSPWFIPGIGIKSIGNVGFNYTVGYKF